jgi:glycosyltransferase involved in cell wall biosynthesis
MYLDRYPEVNPERLVVIQNGYNEEDFAGTESVKTDADGPFRIVHSGLIYPDDRDPRAFFKAVQRFKSEVGGAGVLKIDLRASGSESYYKDLIQQFDIADIVNLLPSLPHREALRDTAAADALLLFQAASCDHQIPAKVYEYLRLRKPILAITSESGDTASLLKEVGGATIADLSDQNSIYQALCSLVSRTRARQHLLPDPQKTSMYTRRSETKDLARLLDEVARYRTSPNGSYASADGARV